MISTFYNNDRGKTFLFSVLFFIVILLSVFLLQTCSVFDGKLEVKKEAKEFRAAKERQQKIYKSVIANVETEPVGAASTEDDAADDPAIWYSAKTPANSIIFGTNKKGGIHAYDLSGRELQFVPCGKINNIDIRRSVKMGKSEVDVLVGSNRSDSTLVLFLIDENGAIKSEADYRIQLGDFEPYGLCLYKTEAASLFAFVNNKNGEVHQITISLDVNNELVTAIVRKLKLPTQVEGMVVDDDGHRLFVGEEGAGIYLFSAWPAGDTDGVLLEGSTESNNKISFDIEGLALLPPHYLVASSQGNFSYAIFDLEKRKYVDSFIIKKGLVDGSEETDGLEIMSKGLGTMFPKGLLVVQDGFNFDDTIKRNQNFKLVDLGEVLSLLGEMDK
ncbi:MAG: 3-phytase [Polaribacter sp.]|jgi:3-phytase